LRKKCRETLPLKFQLFSGHPDVSGFLSCHTLHEVQANRPNLKNRAFALQNGLPPPISVTPIGLNKIDAKVKNKFAQFSSRQRYSEWALEHRCPPGHHTGIDG
jgi:hypothetical protein